MVRKEEEDFIGHVCLLGGILPISPYICLRIASIEALRNFILTLGDRRREEVNNGSQSRGNSQGELVVVAPHGLARYQSLRVNNDIGVYVGKTLADVAAAQVESEPPEAR